MRMSVPAVEMPLACRCRRTRDIPSTGCTS
ncbi:hypothetical protein E2C01_074439 [Portunus trituberculatus]|uniref:Uncharacterized protein n=1 Tax=Portunus trituberculatus TaxID=210409 RepID=A0A5B7ID60_PORTR|nr:hypothetical protein [Portunus trituberculatus]